MFVRGAVGWGGGGGLLFYHPRSFVAVGKHRRKAPNYHLPGKEIHPQGICPLIVLEKSEVVPACEIADLAAWEIAFYFVFSSLYSLQQFFLVEGGWWVGMIRALLLFRTPSHPHPLAPETLIATVKLGWDCSTRDASSGGGELAIHPTQPGASSTGGWWNFRSGVHCEPLWPRGSFWRSGSGPSPSA